MVPRMPRRAALRTVVAAGAVAGVSACTEADRPPSADRTSDASTAPEPEPHAVTLTTTAATVAPDGPDASLAASRTLLESASAVVVAAGDQDLPAASEVARPLRLPVLRDGPELLAELDRLGTRTVLRAAGAPASPTSTSGTPSPSASNGRSTSPAPTAFGDREVVDLDASGTPAAPGLPATVQGSALVLLGPDVTPDPAVTATLDALGVRSATLHDLDPRRSEEDVESLRADPDLPVVGIGGFGPLFARRVRTAQRAPGLPGGGLLPFPARRMVALYGHPNTASLGMLGEQSAQQAVQRVRALAAQYGHLVDDPVVPAFELIATVATGGPGKDRTYSQHTPVKTLRRWVDVAQEAGVYVVLDLQPGRASFLDQARDYASLLELPHVGLALDPEWRLGPKEKPLQRIGHVDVAEVNEVGRWLAGLVREHDLPPKVLTIHQFRTSMVTHRERLDTGLDEIQWLVHADGQGTPNAKQGTWAEIRRDLPDGVWLGWKNFEDEDNPMLSPTQTIAQVTPTPWFVSYQ
ncbi:hypothetical protein JQN72_05600 [Phycicoccus sp. CSK15P-2]|uniref:hypothetical protein n=1 Tax=Phycicoccus sp. CSK15P-2 TaxID=2807627 RepID=UPI0019529940|nr:hypothetical protein [Phycicoccus sp. CSK15P-2]MBM6403714.1 hypothetical protein [Phycicoccus sp. CSK15P-2]